MTEWGKIVAIKGKDVVLSIKKNDNCDKCRKCRPGREENEMIAEARNKAGAGIGDIVEINDNVDSQFAKFFVQLGIPLTDGIIGGAIGYMLAVLFNQNNNVIIWIVLTGIISMIISFKLSRKLLPDIASIKVNKPIVSSIIHKEG